AASILTGLALAALVPWLIPHMFGPAFSVAVAPTLVLILSAIVGSIQWILSRAAAARGNPGLSLVSYGASLVVMVAADVLLIPTWRLMGAAPAPTLGPIVGVVLCIVFYRRHWTTGVPWVEFIPGFGDFKDLVLLPLDLAGVRKAE